MIAALVTAAAFACSTLKNPDEQPLKGGEHSGGEGGDGSGGASAGSVDRGGAVNVAGVSAAGGAGQSGGEAGAIESPGEAGMTAVGYGGVGGGGGYGPGPDGCTTPIDPLASTTHYFCQCPPGPTDCVDGDDNRTGFSVWDFKRTFAKAMQMFATMPGGHTIALCRGGQFDAADVPSNPNCTAKKPCTIRDYVAPWNTPTLPIIVGGQGQVLRISSGEGYRLINLALSGSGTGIAVESGASELLLCGLDLEGLGTGVRLGPATGSATRVILRDSTIRGSVQAGVALDQGGCEGCTLEHNLFEDNGLALQANDASPTLKLASQQPGSGLQIRNNVVRTTSVNGARRCFASALRIDGTQEDLQIEDNVVEAFGAAGTVDSACNGVELDGSLKGLVLRRNRLLDLGRVTIDINDCTDCSVDNNLITQKRTSEYPLTAMSFNGVADGLRIANNTFYVAAASATGSGSSGISFAQDGSATQVVLANNVFLYRGTGSSFSCVKAPAGAARIFAFADNNACYFGSSPAGRWLEGSLAKWSAASGFDRHSFDFDPKLVEQAGPSFLTPDADSPLLGAGDTAHGMTGDIDGSPRGVPPDIGAFER